MSENIADVDTDSVETLVYSNSIYYDVDSQTLIHHTVTVGPSFTIQCDEYGFSFDTYTIRGTEMLFYVDEYAEPIFRTVYSNIDNRLIDVLDELTDDN
jgi:hypothetical protein